MQGVELPSWPALLLFMAAVLTVSTYVIAAAGHFPREHRKPALASSAGTVILWATVVVVALSGVSALVLAWTVLPWYAAVIGAGLMVLIAPYLLHPLPDWFVNGRSLLVASAMLAAVLASVMWWWLE